MQFFQVKIQAKFNISDSNRVWENIQKFTHESFLLKIWLRFTFLAEPAKLSQ